MNIFFKHSLRKTSYIIYMKYKKMEKKFIFFSHKLQRNNLENIPEGYKIIEESNGKIIIKKVG